MLSVCLPESRHLPVPNRAVLCRTPLHRACDRRILQLPQTSPGGAEFVGGYPHPQSLLPAQHPLRQAAGHASGRSILGKWGTPSVCIQGHRHGRRARASLPYRQRRGPEAVLLWQGTTQSPLLAVTAGTARKSLHKQSLRAGDSVGSCLLYTLSRVCHSAARVKELTPLLAGACGGSGFKRARCWRFIPCLGGRG